MHKLKQLGKIIEERIASLREEIEIATNVRLDPLYIDNLRDEIQFLQWTNRLVESTLKSTLKWYDQHQHPEQDEQVKRGTIKQRKELSEIIEFENIIKERIQELNLEPKSSNNLKESDILINEIDTLECVLGHLSDLKYGDKTRAIEIAETNKNFEQAKYLRDELRKIHDIESEINTLIQKRNPYSASLLDIKHCKQI
jgi:hypothetical protein